MEKKTYIYIILISLQQNHSTTKILKKEKNGGAFITFFLLQSTVNKKKIKVNLCLYIESVGNIHHQSKVDKV
jgi:hypothetical protein